MSTPQVSVVVPVYGSAAWLDDLVDRVVRTLEDRGQTYEILLVHDCSPERRTWEAIVRAARRHAHVRGIDLLYRVGQFRATLCGFEHARGERIVTMDDDLQHLPEEIPRLLDTLEADPQLLCVMGRYRGRTDGLLRRMGSHLVQRILDTSYGKPPDVATTSFRVLRRELVDALLAYRTARPQLGPLIISITDRVANVAVSRADRRGGRSGYGLASLLRNTVDSVTHVSTAPLRVFSALGFACAAGSMLFGAWLLVGRWIGKITVAGYASLALLIVFFGGLTLLGVGILGEYVARIITELTGPARWVVRETCEGPE